MIPPPPFCQIQVAEHTETVVERDNHHVTTGGKGFTIISSQVMP